MNKPLVTVITVSFNSAATIKRTIEAVLNQTYENIEYLIIDGASRDDTVDIAKSYEGRFQSKGYTYKIFSEPDDGLYDAMNKGIAMAAGEIIGIVNSDDWYEKDAVEVAVRYYLKRSYDILMCSMNRWKGDSKSSVKTPKIRGYKTSADFCHPGMFVTKKTYEEIGCYDTSFFYADFDFWLRQFKEHRAFVISKKVVTNFALGGVSNQKAIKKMLMRIKDRYHIYRKNGFARIYLIESIGIEVTKMILA